MTDVEQLILDRLDSIDERLKTANGRTSKLESWRDRLIGAWGIVVVLIIPIVIKLWGSK